jgi:hypothetical protein
MFHPLPSLLLLCYYFPFFLPHSSVHLISLSFILPPSFLPSLFFPLLACLSSVSVFLSYFLLYCCLQVYFLFIPLLLTFFFFLFLLLHSFIVSLLCGSISPHHINCAIQLQLPQQH